MKEGLQILLVFAAALWVIELVNALMSHNLNIYGIIPRTEIGLRGIVFAPFLHAGFGHLMSNTLPLLAMGILVATRGPDKLLAALAIIALLSGSLLWAFGGIFSDRVTVHVGASGIVFGLFSLLLTLGWLERNAASIAVAVVVTLLYGVAILSGIAPREGVSWEGHIFGLIAGVAAGYAVKSMG